MRHLIDVILWGALAGAAGDAPPFLAAGYKALFTCSATFLADRTPEQIARNQLTGIYGDYETPMAALPDARIDRDAATVSVSYDEAMPPRIARYRRSLGCTLLPPGAAASMPLPTVELPEPATSATDLDWPDGDRTGKPPLGADARGAPLSRIVASAFDGNSYGQGSRTSAVIVVHGGRLLAEAYAKDSGVHVPQRTWSVAKTIMGALIGIAAAEGLLHPEDRAGLPQWTSPGDPRGDIRIIDLMHMSGGLDAGPVGSRTDAIYFGGGRVEDHALTHELVAPPGKRWFYANNDTLALSYALRARIGDDAAYLAYPYVKLFHRIGMRHSTAETDWGGTFVLSSQVWSTARDLARFGLLLLDDGNWAGEQVLPEGWVAMMSAPAPVQPRLTRLDGAPLPGYGAQVWLFGQRHGLPGGTFAAMGNRGQYIVVVPERKAVIVRRGWDFESGGFAIDPFTADVLAAVNEGRIP